jgi:uncharacterized Fe-S cluster-containing MiaB family protein
MVVGNRNIALIINKELKDSKYILFKLLFLTMSITIGNSYIMISTSILNKYNTNLSFSVEQ